MSTPRPLRLAVPDSAIEYLRERLARTRWPDEPPLARKVGEFFRSLG
jgi:microsomal epoxide hydrolase